MVSKDRITKIKFYSGMRTIGGTFIEVGYKDSRIVFDFGAQFNPNFKSNDLSFDEIIDNELAPKLDGIYDDRHYKITNSYENNAVFISHAHLDHTKMLNYIDESIPLYMSKETKNLVECLNINGNFLYPNKYLSSNTRNIIPCDYGEEVQVGDILVKFIRVDHDAYGACALLITTPDYKIAYSGDIRLHGNLIQESENFINLSKDVDMLIIEGVSVSFDNEENSDNRKFESDVINEFNKIVNEDRNRAVYFNYYLANIGRILDIINSTDRIVVLDAYYSYLVKKVSGVETYYYDNNVSYDLDDALELDIKDILNDPKYLIQIPKDKSDIMKESKENSAYIHFDSEPLGDFDPEFAPFIEKIKSFKIMLHLLHCSGHAYPEHLRYIIEQIKPKLLVPIHSFKPEMLYNVNGERLLPEENQIY